MIDWMRITELQREIGADDLGDLVDIFLEEVDDEIAALRSASNPADMQARLHLIRGSALNLGFRAFSKACQKGEAAIADGCHAGVDLPAILHSYAESRAEFLTGLAKVAD